MKNFNTFIIEEEEPFHKVKIVKPKLSLLDLHLNNSKIDIPIPDVPVKYRHISLGSFNHEGWSENHYDKLNENVDWMHTDISALSDIMKHLGKNVLKVKHNYTFYHPYKDVVHLQNHNKNHIAIVNDCDYGTYHLHTKNNKLDLKGYPITERENLLKTYDFLKNEFSE